MQMRFVNDGDEHFAQAVEIEGCVNEALFPPYVNAVEVDVESTLGCLIVSTLLRGFRWFQAVLLLYLHA
jgi:hypothetical protein